MITKLLDDLNKDVIEEDHYTYNNINVPRVTKILSTIHEEYLMKWANNIGLYQRRKYEDEREKAAYIGTQSHNGIEQYIKDKVYSKSSIKDFDENNIKQIDNGIRSFILWYNDISINNKLEIIFIEETLTCPYCGGTLDMLCKINGVYYLIDFKTSNNIGYKYFMQLAAYKYMLKIVKNIDIGGCIILQLNKKKVQYTEYTLDLLHDKFHLDFINQCELTFFSVVYTYYNKIITENMYKEYLNKRG